MTARPKKHSLTLKGHRTSVSLEAEFWTAFREIAAAQGKPVNVLAAEIDTDRTSETGQIETGLASAIRIYVLGYYRNIAKNAPPHN